MTPTIVGEKATLDTSTRSETLKNMIGKEATPERYSRQTPARVPEYTD
jgi:hypothetical protein